MDYSSPNSYERLVDERLAHIVRQLARDFQNCLEERIQPYGVNHGFWAYLRELWEEDGVSQRDLSERVGLSGPTTNSVVKRMVVADLVELCPIVEGKPRMLVHLTDRGRSLRGVLEPLAEEVNTIAVRDMSSDETDILRTFLLKMLSNLRAAELPSTEPSD